MTDRWQITCKLLTGAAALVLFAAEPVWAEGDAAKGEKIYKELGLALRPLGDDELIAAMAANPILIERPVVFANGKAALGRPPENVLKIL